MMSNTQGVTGCVNKLGGTLVLFVGPRMYDSCISAVLI
jgi:hypothetical protein